MVSLFLFGKKKKKVSRKKKTNVKKPPVNICKMCKRLKIKITKKVGNRRVYKSTSVLKKQIKQKMRKKAKRVTRFGFSFGSTRKSRFGNSGAVFNNNTPAYGYNEPVIQKPGILAQTSQVVTSTSNSNRPIGSTLSSNIPTYGVNRMFFNESVPTQVPPNWNFMGQPDGSAIPVGAPFYGYTTPFGRRRRRRATGFGKN
jgi:hypothetical protein